MTDIEERINFRKTLLNDSRDYEGFISQSDLLAQILPSMLDAKLVDSEDYNDSYYVNEYEKLKLNAYAINESGERLQLFVIDENTINEKSKEEELLVSQRADYENQFKRVERIVKKHLRAKCLNQYKTQAR